MKNKFRVLSHVIQETTEATSLSWIQKLVCKWFKIVPEKKYWYTVKVMVDDPSFVRQNDGVMSSDGNKWRVCNFDENKNIELRNISPTIINRVGGEMVVFCSMYPEGSRINSSVLNI